MTKNSDSRDIYQKTISKALERILHTDDIQEALTDVLQDVLKYFKAGRVAVMSTVKRNPGFQYCVMEVLAEGISSSMSGRERKFSTRSPWYKQSQKGETEKRIFLFFPSFVLEEFPILEGEFRLFGRRERRNHGKKEKMGLGGSIGRRGDGAVFADLCPVRPVSLRRGQHSRP